MSDLLQCLIDHETGRRMVDIRGVEIVVARVSADGATDWSCDHDRSHLIVNVGSAMDEFEASTHGRLFLGAPSIGDFSWIPAGSDYAGWYGGGVLAFLSISVPRQWPSPALPVLATFDAKVLSATRTILLALARSDLGDVYRAVEDIWRSLLAQERRVNVRRGTPLADRRFEAAQRLIADQTATLRTTRELATALGASVDGLDRTFQSRFGCSTSRFLDDNRLRAARRLITRTDVGFGSIAAQCGFASQAHMTDRMRQRLGVTPGGLRAVTRAMADPQADAIAFEPASLR